MLRDLKIIKNTTLTNSELSVLHLQFPLFLSIICNYINSTAISLVVNVYVKKRKNYF